MYWKKVHKIKNPPWETISIDNYQEVVNYGLDHKKISKLKLIYAQHNNLFMAYLLVWAVSFCRRFFCPLYPRILKAFLLRMLWSWKIDELCEKGGKNVSFFVIFNSYAVCKHEICMYFSGSFEVQNPQSFLVLVCI